MSREASRSEVNKTSKVLLRNKTGEPLALLFFVSTVS